MATQSTYYLNGPDLASSTAIFSDAELTTCAADGYYRQGSIVRQMVGCVLLPQQICPSCADLCGEVNINSTNAQSVSYISIDTGSGVGDVGAIVIRFNPQSIPDGIQVEFDGVIYNALSSPVYGYLGGTPNLPTYIGESAQDCGIVSNSPFVFDVYNWYNGSFQTPTSTEVVSVLSGQMDLTALIPDECVMVIPKPTGVPSIVNIKIISPCDPGDFYINIECPTLLSPLERSEVFETSELVCNDVPSTVFYTVHVNGSGGVLGLYDWVFYDQNGENVLPDGYYKSTACPSTNDWFKVSQGVIIQFGTCP